jgi:hypothetical protein
MSKNVKWFWSVFLVAFVTNNEYFYCTFLLVELDERD